MRILVTPIPGGTGTGQELTGNTPFCTVRGMGGACEWSDQVNRFVDAQSAAHADRGNVINHLDFEVSRFWPTPAQAASFHLLHPDTVPHIGNVAFLVLAPTMIVASTLNALAVSIKVTRIRWEGSMTVMQYHFQCGVLAL